MPPIIADEQVRVYGVGLPSRRVGTGEVDKAQLLEAVMTPQMRLRILVNQVRRRDDGGADAHVDRVVNGAVQRVRRAAATR